MWEFESLSVRQNNMNKHYIVAHYTPLDGELFVDIVLAKSELAAINAAFKTEYESWDVLWEALDNAEITLKVIECSGPDYSRVNTKFQS